MTQEENQKKLILAAVYAKMSTDHQECSIENQLNAINQYAQEYGYKINKIFKDEGKSGLQIKGREQFQALINIVETGEADFSAVLVYDVSRWGVFKILMKQLTISIFARRQELELFFVLNLSIIKQDCSLMLLLL